MYLPVNPVAPKTVTDRPETEDLPPILAQAHWRKGPMGDQQGMPTAAPAWPKMNKKGPSPSGPKASKNPIDPKEPMDPKQAIPQRAMDYDDHVCNICADHNPKYWVVGECNHRVCWMCSLRLRILYGKTDCAICKISHEQVYIGKQAGEGTYERLVGDTRSRKKFDQERGLVFEDETVEREVDGLLKLKCPFTGCKSGLTFSSKQDLRRHVSSSHSLSLCDICLAHKKVFSSEMRLFNPASLQKHHHDHHPSCKICGTMFFSEDELAEHNRDKHEKCHICWKRDPRSTPYYRDYYSLEAHFRKDHYLCPERLCLDLKFVVFGSEIEYKAHMGEVHLAHTKMQRSQHKQLTRIDPSFITTTQSRSERAARGTELRPPQPARPSPAPQPAPVIDSSRLFFGDSISALAGKLASFSLYEQRNDEFFQGLRQSESLSSDSIKQLQATCQMFQEGRGMTVQDWVRRVFEQLGVERAKRVVPSLIELQLDSMKRNDMKAVFRGHVFKLEAFPPLPSTSQPTRPSSEPAYLSGSKVTPKLGPAAKPIRLISNRNPVVDPTKNPLGISGFGTGRITKSIAPKKSAPATPPGFSRAAATGTGTGMSSVTLQASAPAKHLDESQYPSLPSSSKASSSAPADLPAPSNNAFASGFEGDDEFVIGAGSSPSNEASSSATKKKTKRQVVLRFG